MKIRTIDQAIAEIKENDPNTAITRYALKQLIINGEIPYKKSGKKYLLNMDDIDRYYNQDWRC